MSTNGHNQASIKCPHCKQQFGVVMPCASVFNDLKVSMAVAAHEKPIRCIYCDKFSVPAMQSAQLAWQIIPLTDEQAEALGESKIITPTLRDQWGPGF